LQRSEIAPVAIDNNDDKVTSSGKDIVVATADHKQKNTHQLSLLDALSKADQSINTANKTVATNSTAGLGRPGLHVSSQKTWLSPVHLDCSRANVGTLSGIVEGASVS